MTRKNLPRAIRKQSGEPLRIGITETADGEPAHTQRLLNPIPNHPLPIQSASLQLLAEKRRVLARKVVERHKTYAAIGGLIPLPVANVATVSAVIMTMVKKLSALYGVPFEQERARSIITGLVGGAAPTGVGTAATSALAFALPGSGFVGLALSAVTAATLTRGIGLVFLDHFENAESVRR